MDAINTLHKRAYIENALLFHPVILRLVYKELPATNTAATAPRRLQRTTKGKSPSWLGNEQVAALEQGFDLSPLPTLKQNEVIVPNTYKEAVSSPLAPYWRAAMTTQVEKIKITNT
ncbi:hypothetical protein BO83DRAFT_388804 [Aspergillus eucalypticola CBS 122712]|uniref:Uncharacterized protein n=1 Tax=Aspergillus eucalypticola (strain CBS 122712 / IBT 29274) TaxID=1448314 RepID=A0A317VGD6_ASPEC|nr:uncharacterized protein BO83DRAFT_388804 [Aspergillus eucalypticola CBS 122712]PWY73443.1 hypothetical protein BO83DRAFT_388804 [Aspergillus eucalypticola CBS 122712]